MSKRDALSVLWDLQHGRDYKRLIGSSLDRRCGEFDDHVEIVVAMCHDAIAPAPTIEEIGERLERCRVQCRSGTLARFVRVIETAQAALRA
ncbi:MAG: hypothetical protein ABI647_15950 [Gemmatimonadota bacterium]